MTRLASDPLSLAVPCKLCRRAPRERCINRATGRGTPTHKVRIADGRAAAAGEPVVRDAPGPRTAEHNRRLLAAARRYLDDDRLTRAAAAAADGFSLQQISYAAVVLRQAPDLVARVEAGTLTFSAALNRARGRPS